MALGAIACAAVGCAADPAPPHKVSASEAAQGVPPADLPANLRGKTVQLTYDSGSGGTATYSDEGDTLTYVAADTGRRTTAPVAIAPIDSGIFLVTWAEDGTGAVISQVQDYRTGKVRATWARRPDPAAPFTFEIRSGAVHLTD
ncbi:MoaF-related domain-containing protein [Nocardia sp. NPDC055321]